MFIQLVSVVDCCQSLSVLSALSNIVSVIHCLTVVFQSSIHQLVRDPLNTTKCMVLLLIFSHSVLRLVMTKPVGHSGPSSNDDYLGHSKNHD